MIGDTMITCSVCGCLNDPSNTVCKECGSDLIDEYEVIMFDEDTNNDSGFDDRDNPIDNLDYDYDEYEDDF